MAASRNIERLSALPDWPALLTLEAAAAFTSLPVAAFRRAVDRGELPAPDCIAGRRLWARCKIEARFAPSGERPAPDWDPISAAISAG